jgi:CHAT domain-containing protein/tetratricopeptide (TPR) repeat protein
MRFATAAACALILRCLSVVSGATLLLTSAIAPAAAQQGDLHAIIWRYHELYAAGNYSAALVEAQKFEAGIKARSGTHNANYSLALNNLANVYRAQGKYAEAEALHKRALAIYEALGKDHPDVAATLSNLAGVYEAQGKYAEAEANYKRALAIDEAKLGNEHPEVATLLDNLAQVYANQGKYAEAEALNRRALAIYETKLGKDHPEVATSLHNLATTFERQGKYAEAEAHERRALSIWETKLGKDDNNVAAGLNTLAGVYLHQGKYAEAEAQFKRALSIKERKFGKDHPEGAVLLSNLAVVYAREGKYAEAEMIERRALAIVEKKLGMDHPSVATSLRALASDYADHGNYTEAEALYRRALAIYETKLGNDHPDVAETLTGLASVYEEQAKYAEAETLFKRALGIQEAKLGSEHPTVANTLNALGYMLVFRVHGRYAEAEGLFKRALAIREKALGENHPDVAQSLSNLGLVYAAQGEYDQAEAGIKRALAIREKAWGENHPDVALTLNNLASLYATRGDAENALAYSRRATAALIAHAATDTAAGGQNDKTGELIEQRAEYFRLHVANLAAAGRKGIEPQSSLAPEGLEIAQWAGSSSAAGAVQQMAVRFAAGNDALANLVRERQDLAALWRDRDKTLVGGLSKPEQNRSTIEGLRKELSEIEKKSAAASARLEHEFPEYAALTNPKPLKASQIQALLGGDEALLFWLVGNKESYVFALTREAFEWKTIPLGAPVLSEKVTAFRHGLDVDALRRGLERVDCTQAEADKRGLSRVECGQALAKECEEAEKRGLAREDCTTAQGPRGLFDLVLAHELYAVLIGPVERLLRDKRHLIVVPSGALTALPFHLLVTEKPGAAVPQVKAPRDLAAYRDAAWLLKRHAVSVLPSVANLKALRMFARKDLGSKPMIGFGDPIFGPEAAPEASQRTAQARALVTRSYTDYWQGAGIDRSKLAQALPRLPDTADELKAVAQKLGAPASDIKLRKDASETNVKRAPLADYRVVYFATHGLVAGDIKGLAEPSLALTIPKEPSDLDDGLLTASEVAQLKLNADWVVLSACNTIAGDKPGAEALSGLARAFFYAGAHALLVSHWAVDSNAATRLTTATFDIMKSDPQLGRAEALRRAMLAYMNDATGPLNAYPALWAPFVIVGEGAGR